MAIEQKDISWLGSSEKDLNSFPREALLNALFQLDKVRSGLEPTDWKPFNEVGAGTKEIRIRDKDGIAVSNNKDMLNNIKSLKNQLLKFGNNISVS